MSEQKDRPDILTSELTFDEWYDWFTGMLNRKPTDAEKNAIRHLVEEAKREERERIIERLRQLMGAIQSREKHNGVREAIKCIQALKGEK